MLAPFAGLDWTQAHRDELKLADVRWYLDGRSGRAAYEQGHIPGAVFVDLDQVLSAPHDDPSLGRHPLPTPERFAAGLGEAGIGDGDTVLAYDDAGGVIAARLVWLLRAIGHPAALLDGGVQAWPQGELETGAAPTTSAHFTQIPWPAEKLAGIDEVATTTDVLIDARDRGRFAGGPDPVDPRSGHIPGARSIPVAAHLDPDSRRVAGAAQLRETFAAAGIGAGTPVISYCGSGVTACFNLLALERAGLHPGRLFVGSWSQWSRDPTRPIATGAD